MFNAIPATTALGIANPMTQQTGLANVSLNIRTNNQEQLEARSVTHPKETRQARQLKDHRDEENQEAEEDYRDSSSSSDSSTLAHPFRKRQHGRADTTASPTDEASARRALVSSKSVDIMA